LQPYKFTIEHVEEKKLIAADGLSRRPYDEPGDLSGDEELQEDSFIAQIQPYILIMYQITVGDLNSRTYMFYP